jgi:hypothetical protein
LSKKRPKKKLVESEEPATTATPISDPSVSDHESTTEREREREESLRLEEDLDAAVRNASVSDGTTQAEEGKLDS